MNPIKPVRMGPFFGINNKLPSDKLTSPRTPLKPGGNFVRDAVNVDITEAGTFQRRPGREAKYAGIRCRSLWSDGNGQGYFVDESKLYAFNGEGATLVTTLLSPGSDVSFSKTPLGVVWSDTSTLGLIRGTVSQPLVTPLPNPTPLVLSTTGGSLQAGSYVLSFAAVDSVGIRSALTDLISVDVPDGGAISVTVAGGNSVEVFATSPGGSTLFSQGLFTAPGVHTLSLVYSDGRAVADLLETPMAGGNIVREYHGRLLVVNGNVLSYSQPWAYGLTLPTQNYLMFDEPITLCEPNENGVFLATPTQTWFMNGADFADATLVPLAPYGAVPNTVAYDPVAHEMWWFSSRGTVKTNGNDIELHQDDNIAFGAAGNGAALLREDNGLSQYVAVVSDVQPTGAAIASTYMTAEVIAPPTQD